MRPPFLRLGKIGVPAGTGQSTEPFIAGGGLNGSRYGLIDLQRKTDLMLSSPGVVPGASFIRAIREKASCVGAGDRPLPERCGKGQTADDCCAADAGTGRCDGRTGDRGRSERNAVRPGLHRRQRLSGDRFVAGISARFSVARGGTMWGIAPFRVVRRGRNPCPAHGASRPETTPPEQAPYRGIHDGSSIRRSTG